MLTAVQIGSARSAVAAAFGTLETKSGQLGLAQITSGATPAGILIALGVLAMSVGLIRSESTSDLRTLAAAGHPGVPAARSPARQQPRSRSSGPHSAQRQPSPPS